MTRREKTVFQMSVDRIEEGHVILIPQDHPEETITIPLKYLPGVEEGDILELSFRKDEVASREAAYRVEEIRERLLSR
jgi:hypothetical protein